MSKRKKTSKTSASDFAAAINKILSSSVKPIDKNIPILSRSKGIERRIDDAKLEYRARRAINIEKKKLAHKDRIKVDFTTIDTERKLRKIATRGVIQLFNAIHISQKIVDNSIKEAGGKQRLTTREAKDVSSMSKEKFLDLLKGGL
ncbi:14466_t:CDS:2 [Cetraspora pellucida]|uniref:14466_t:CDS:1 n=1 Tax=Cetraspora pellucida TaxID=1433469 RepID=A0A9N9J959_9GLOM|nr:14466_t:CDS:2 [Cetraspora pellucida]